MPSAVVVASGIASSLGTAVGVALWVAAIIALRRWWLARRLKTMFDPTPTFTGTRPASTSPGRVDEETGSSGPADDDGPPTV